MRVAKGRVVAINYTLRTNGVVRHVRSALWGDRPLEYLHGAGNIIPGLEQALEGRMAGDRFSVTVPPAEAYGQRDRALQQKVPAALFGGADQVEPGMRFQARGEDGKHVETLTITELDPEEQTVTVDANHPLAGMTLEFDVKVEGVREASEAELERGCVSSRCAHEAPKRAPLPVSGQP